MRDTGLEIVEGVSASPDFRASPRVLAGLNNAKNLSGMLEVIQDAIREQCAALAAKPAEFGKVGRYGAIRGTILLGDNELFDVVISKKLHPTTAEKDGFDVGQIVHANEFFLAMAERQKNDCSLSKADKAALVLYKKGIRHDDGVLYLKDTDFNSSYFQVEYDTPGNQQSFCATFYVRRNASGLAPVQPE